MIKFGAFADLHYAKGLTIGKRRCDLSLLRLQRIADDFNKYNLDFCICLGDIITSVQDFEIDKSNIQRVSSVFKKFNMPHHIVLGNHDLEAMSKSDFYKIFGEESKIYYYSFIIAGTRFIVLDANYLADGSDYECGNYNWVDSYIPRKQLLWLDNELKSSEEENIVIFSHQNLDYRLHDNALDSCVIKNYSEVSQLLESHKKSITVIQGHYHNGDYQEINGITYITLKAVCVGDDITSIPRVIVSMDDDVTVQYLE